MIFFKKNNKIKIKTYNLLIPLIKLNFKIISKNFLYKNNLPLKSFFLITKKDNNYDKKISLLNYFYLSKFLLVLDLAFKEKNNFLILDNNYKNIIPLYNLHYGIKNIFKEKSFFFIDKSCLSKTNWLYFYSLFLKKNKIKLLLVFNYKYYSKFFKYFLKFNLPIFSIVPSNYSSDYLDFFFYSDQNNIIANKIIIFNLVYSYFYKNFSYKNYFNKYYFLKYHNKSLL